MNPYPALSDAPNASELCAKIQNAAQQITLLYRSSGRKFFRDSVDVPLLDEVEPLLMRLVDQAIGNLHTVQEEAPSHAEELTGVHEDGLFEAEVELQSDGSLSLEIYFRLI